LAEALAYLEARTARATTTADALGDDNKKGNGKDNGNSRYSAFGEG
jgi:hypothetical protein